MEVWVLTECTMQGEYTEPAHYASASDAREIMGVYSSSDKAKKEKERLEALAKQAQDDFDADPCYYEVAPFEVQ